MRLLSVILTFFAIVTLATPGLLQAAPADTEISAEEHSKRGVELYAEGKLPEAVREMLKAYELAPEPGLLYNIARIYQKMGEDDLATHYFKKFVTFEGADPDRVEKALTHLEDLKKKRATPPPAAPVSAPEKPDDTSTDTAVPEASEPPVVTSTASPSEPSGNLIAWSLIGAGGAGLAVGAILGNFASNAADELNDPLRSYDDKIDSQQSSRDLALGADISMALGLAAAGTGLFLLLSSDDNEERAVAVTPSFGPGYFSANLSVRFP